MSSLCYEMAASLLAVKNNSLQLSQSIFNEIQSIHDTGLFNEIESGGKYCGVVLVTSILAVLPLFNLCLIIEYYIGSVKVSVAYSFFLIFWAI